MNNELDLFEFEVEKLSPEGSKSEKTSAIEVNDNNNVINKKDSENNTNEITFNDDNKNSFSLAEKYITKSTLPQTEISNKLSSRYDWVCNSLFINTGMELIGFNYSLSFEEIESLYKSNKIITEFCSENNTYSTWILKKSLKRK